MSLKTKLAMAATLLGFASQAMAANITIQDYNGPGQPVNKPLWGFNGGPFGTGAEDNETENGTIRGQQWDLEAFSIVGSKLYLVGGYNFAAGLSGGAPGDLFIKIGGAATYLPLSGSTVLNSTYGYNYAVNLTGGLGGGSVGVQSLLGTSTLNTVINDSFGSNPWKYASGGGGSAPTAMTYASGLTAGQVGTLTGVGGLAGESGNQLHNVVGIDLGFLGTIPAGTEVYFSYTMECGNDMMKGSFDGGFRIPDGGTTLMLLGVGLTTLSMVGRKLRTA